VDRAAFRVRPRIRVLGSIGKSLHGTSRASSSSFVVVVVLGWNVVVLGQVGGPPTAGELSDFRHPTWVVTRVCLQDLSGKNDQLVADFAAKHQARACAVRLNKEEKDPAKWWYAYRARSGAIVGNAFQGKVGKYRVVIRFCRQWGISVEGECRPRHVDPNQKKRCADGDRRREVCGTVEGERISGQRFVKIIPSHSWPGGVRLGEGPADGPAGGGSDKRKTSARRTP